MKSTLKNRILKNCIIIGMIIIALSIVFANNSNKLSLIKSHTKQKALTDDKYDNLQKLIREVANAYYQKGLSAQYCSFRLSRFYPPEEATPQHTIYTVCSDFTYLVYYQALGVKLPYGTPQIITYADKYYDINNITTNDVIEYWQRTTDENNNSVYMDNKGNKKNIDLSTESGRMQYALKLLKDYNLQVGDVLCYNTGVENGSAGHALLVYEIIYDKNGEPIDALIRESSSKYEKSTTKITKGLSYGEELNENNNVNEGTFKELYLANNYNTSSTITRNSVVYNFRKMSYFTILRPLLKEENGDYTGKYYYATFKTQAGTPPTGNVCTGRTLTDYSITSSTLNRSNYSGIDIEKTVDVFNNSVVNLEDKLEYTIKISNKSNENYSSFDITENISDYVELVDIANGTLNGNTITWRVEKLEAGKSIEVKYKVKIKNDTSLLAKVVVSTGTVAGIPSSTITNTISSNLNENDKVIISSKAQYIMNSSKSYGQELIHGVE